MSLGVRYVKICDTVCLLNLCRCWGQTDLLAMPRIEVQSLRTYHSSDKVKCSQIIIGSCTAFPELIFNNYGLAIPLSTLFFSILFELSPVHLEQSNQTNYHSYGTSMKVGKIVVV